jgi:putative transposase
MKGQFTILNKQVVEDSIDSVMCINKLDVKSKKRKRDTFTPEYHLTNKGEILRDKYKTSAQAIPNISSSQMWPRELILTGGVCKPFWNKFSKETSQKLLSPIGIDCVDLPLTSSNSSLQKLTQNSWFSVQVKTSIPQKKNSLKTSWPLQQFLWQKITAFEHQRTENDEPVRKKIKVENEGKLNHQPPIQVKKEKPVPGQSQKWRIFPSKEERKLIDQWIGTARWTYNKSVEVGKKEGWQRITQKHLRSRHINNEVVPQWALETPYEIRDQAAMDLKNAVKINLQKRRKKQIHNFDMKYRSKKNHKQTITILHRLYNTKNGKVSFLKNIKAVWNKTATKLPPQVLYAVKLTKTRSREYYLSIPKPLLQRSDNQAPKVEQFGDGVISIDPGIRTFATCYEASGTIYEWGKSDINRIQRLCHHYDRLWSKLCHLNKWGLRRRGRKRIKEALQRMQRRIRHLVDEMHRKLAKWLLENHHVILLPKFQAKGMTRKLNRRINGKTARMMLTWSHYRFRMHLLQKSLEYPWVHLMLVGEEFTTKTCHQCGFINGDIKGSKVFVCSKCQYKVDRDVNGAMNILLKYLSECAETCPWL